MGIPCCCLGRGSAPRWGRRAGARLQRRKRRRSQCWLRAALPARGRAGGAMGASAAEEMEVLSQRCRLLPAAQGCPRAGRGALLLVSAVPPSAACLGAGDAGDAMGAQGTTETPLSIREPHR